MNVFVPVNFSIKRSELGYEVYSDAGEHLGTSLSLDDTRQFMPDGAREKLREVHAVRLPLRSEIDCSQAAFPPGDRGW